VLCVHLLELGLPGGRYQHTGSQFLFADSAEVHGFAGEHTVIFAEQIVWPGTAVPERLVIVAGNLALALVSAVAVGNQFQEQDCTLLPAALAEPGIGTVQVPVFVAPVSVVPFSEPVWLVPDKVALDEPVPDEVVPALVPGTLELDG